MPYFIFKISPLKTLEKQGEATSYKEAKALANELRKQLDPKSGYTVRLTFADSEFLAEEQLTRPREPDPFLASDEY